MSELHLDPARWARIEALPLPKGLGDLETGLCAAARIAYYATGEVTARLDCVSQVALAYLMMLQDRLPDDLRQQLGSVEYRDALLATTPSDDARLAWFAAESTRQDALRTLGYAGLGDAPEALALRACSPIIDTVTAQAVADAASDAADAAAATDAAYGARAAARYAADAAHDAAIGSPYASSYAVAAAAAARRRDAAGSYYAAHSPAEWRHAIGTLRTLLGLPTKATP